MTENKKRFELIELYGDDHLIDNETNEKIGYDLHSPSTFNANWNNVCNLLNALYEKKEELQEVLNEINYNSTKDKKIEIEHINTIYKELGFDGVIDYAKDKLSEFGSVKEVEDGLWLMATGGWSDNEHWIGCLNHLISNFGRLHYRAYERGGAFYYTEEPRADVEISLKKEVKE